MDWTAKVDIYCERTDFAFWSEPLNAVTNLSFILAALFCWNLAVRRDRMESLTVALLLILTAVGVGSFLFHTVAARWAGAADTAPILAFILVYIYAATRRYFGAPVWMSFAVPVLFVPFAIGFAAAWDSVLPSINGSEGYMPVLVILLIYAVALARLGHPAAAGMLAGAAVFSASLTFRSLDGAVCGALPIGTHFLWHVLNGVLLGAVLATFIRHGAPRVTGRLAAEAGRG